MDGLAALNLPRLSTKDKIKVRDYFEAGPEYPAIFTDALTDWPAWRKWSIEWFAREYGDVFGVIPTSFSDSSGGKAALLRDYLAHLDGPVRDTPGFWVNKDGMPIEEPSVDPDQSWAFRWKDFQQTPDLMADIGSWPAGTENLVEALPPDVVRLIEKICARNFFALYISRRGTITPLHIDYCETIGSLAQFEGKKKVTLIEPSKGDEPSLEGFDPEAPDLDKYPNAIGKIVYQGELCPGDLLIIPPLWWHHVRSLEHSVTLSHNFFTPATFGNFLRNIFDHITRTDPETLNGQIAGCIGSISNQTDR